MKPGEWKTLEGKILRLEEMSASHLANAIAMLDRQIRTEEYSVALYDSLNGEMAREAAGEVAGRSMLNAHLFKAKRDELQAELDRRRAITRGP